MRVDRPTLALAVQSASVLPAPSRAQLRRWVQGVLAMLADAAAVAGTRSVRDATLTIRFVDEDEGRALNRTFRGKDYATNVLTFPYEGAPGTVEADLVVCLPVVEAEALAQHKPVGAHCGHLVVHGTLHACGYDHEDPAEADAMEALERRVLARFRIADPYAAAH